MHDGLRSRGQHSVPFICRLSDPAPLKQEDLQQLLLLTASADCITNCGNVFVVVPSPASKVGVPDGGSFCSHWGPPAPAVKARQPVAASNDIFFIPAISTYYSPSETFRGMHEDTALLEYGWLLPSEFMFC